MTTKILGHTLAQWAPVPWKEGIPIPQWLAPSFPLKGYWPWKAPSTGTGGGGTITTYDVSFSDGEPNAYGLTQAQLDQLINYLQGTGVTYTVIATHVS